jgi:hypothetical protein
MLRTVLAVALAIALLGVSLPAVDSARVTHAESDVQRSLTRLETAATELAAHNDAVPNGTVGARRHLTLSLPSERWGQAGLDSLSFPPGSTHLSWRVRGGDHRTYASSVPLAGPSGGLKLNEGGHHRIILALHHRNGREVVVVRRPDV